MTSEQIRSTVAKTVGRRGFVPALLASTGIFAVVIVQGFALSALSSPSFLGYGDDGASELLGRVWLDQLQFSLTGSLPFAIGVFLSLWQVAPIGPELRLAHVVTRALLAAALGAAAVVVAVVLLSLIGVITQIPSLVFGLGDVAGGPFSGFAESVRFGVVSAAEFFVQHLPVVALGAILLWGWLDRHPLRHDVAGALDEV